MRHATGMMQRIQSWFWWGAVAAWMALIWWLSDQPQLTTGLGYDWWLRKLAHVMEYAVLVGLWYGAGRTQWRPRPTLCLAAVAALGWAGIDEWHQLFVLGRHGTGKDVMIDAVGVVLAVGAILWRRWYTANEPVSIRPVRQL